MRQPRRSERTFLCTLVLLAACGADSIDGSEPCAISEGALVITEIHANPDGKDGIREYVELHNVTNRDIPLLGASLTSSRIDGTGAESHRFGVVSVAAEGYLVAGNADVDALPDHVDYSYGSTLGSLRNADAILSVSCGSIVVDQVEYSRTKDGHALELDGSDKPDVTRNDDGLSWCFASTETIPGEPGDFGSPGRPNPACNTEVRPVPCTSREGIELSAPRLGQARITEWMANPKGIDGDLEWVEVQIDAPVNLSGLHLATDPEAHGPAPFGECFPVDTGVRVVFGASPAAAPRVDAELGITLGNSGPQMLILATDEIELDRITYDGTTQGRAIRIDATEATCTVLPDPRYEYAEGNFGTPGEPNPECPVELGPGMCLDAGIPRHIRSGSIESIQITEWMARPAKGDPRGGEWVELRITEDIDLNGLTWSDRAGASMGLASSECIHARAGTWLVFARSEDPLENGGLPYVDYALPTSLNNTDERISISIDGEVLDSIEYERSIPGVAWQVDDSGTRCEASSEFGSGDLGTPGASNPACP